MAIEGIVQLKSGDAVRGIVFHRAIWWRHLKIERTPESKVIVMDGKTTKSSTADGLIWVPKGNVNFIQELVKVAV